MSSGEPVAGMLNTCKQQWAANGVGITLLWYAIGREGSPQKLGVGRPPSTGNSHFPCRPGAPSYGRVGRKFQRMREGAVGRGPAASTHTGTNMTSSYRAVRKTNMGIPDIYLIRVAFQSM